MNNRPSLNISSRTPCMACPNRFPGCHADCTAYASWQRQHALDRAAYARQFDDRRTENESLARRGYFAKRGQM